eukprot:TRINITY_DN27664_c0_g1_i4.p4 TRINITY_DN27664_c0_g1~~TRINITY_DN27664_c0_g1_i4.p4  ORF type:complete len:110 (-),score=13.05 TRINITY_DN27664_c0_g1_i4:1149-1478(-)
MIKDVGQGYFNTEFQQMLQRELSNVLKAQVISADRKINRLYEAQKDVIDSIQTMLTELDVVIGVCKEVGNPGEISTQVRKIVGAVDDLTGRMTAVERRLAHIQDKIVAE